MNRGSIPFTIQLAFSALSMHDSAMETSIIRRLIRLALEEDVGTGDITASAIPAEKNAVARLIAKEACTVSGLEITALVLEEFKAQAQLQIGANVRDGVQVPAGTEILTITGNARDLLTCERTILNLLQHLFGVATQARKYKEALGDSPVKILDTRKTHPGLRDYEKKAVRDGGLFNHRARLDDGILVKENHIRAAGSIPAVVQALKPRAPAGMAFEVEVTSWEEAKEALDQGVSHLLLDNFTPPQLLELVPKLRSYKQNLLLEASGGINLSNLREYGKTGIDCMSMGALTHSVKAIDLSLQFRFT